MTAAVTVTFRDEEIPDLIDALQDRIENLEEVMSIHDPTEYPYEVLSWQREISRLGTLLDRVQHGEPEVSQEESDA